MNKRIRKKKRKPCEFCGKLDNTKEIYGDMQICKDCLATEEKHLAIAMSIEG